MFAILPTMFQHTSPCSKSLSRCSPKAKLFKGHLQAVGAAKTTNNLTGSHVCGSHPAPGRTHHTRSSSSIDCPFPVEVATTYSPYRGFRARLNSPHSTQQQHTEQVTPNTPASSATAFNQQHSTRKHPPPLLTGRSDWRS